MRRSQTAVTFILVIAGFLATLSHPSLADIPKVISYQGKVTDSGGTPVADGSYLMRFRIYNAATGGTLRWDGGTRWISVTSGVFNVLLGESPQPSINLPFDEDYWLLVTFDGDDQTPRQRLASSGYAYMASMASGLVPGTEVSGSVPAGVMAAIKGTNTATNLEIAGVSGSAPTLTGFTTYGVFGQSASTAGHGVFGFASCTYGVNHGVYGQSRSTDGVGVYGRASATTGLTYGVRGYANSASGYGGYFSGRLRAATSINQTATPDNHVAQIYNTSTGISPDVLSLKVGYNGHPSGNINFITFFRGGDVAVGAVEGDGGGGVTYKSGSADFAEFLPQTNPGETMEPGDIVGVFDGQVSRRTHGASQHLVISTRPIVLGNDPGEENADAYARVAFIGQVDVNVRGVVNASDLLITSGLEDGTAIAVAPEEITSAQFTRVVGQAWESSADSGVKKVRASIGLLNHDPTVARMAERIRQLEERLTALEVSHED